MSQSTIELPLEIETWAKDHVYHWLTTEVKVHHTCAERFIEEDVSGKVLDDFEKQDILYLGIKHGPAVKITTYLERLKEGSQQESQSPSDVENWTKEQVAQWLLQHVKLDAEKAERFQEEEVSGDCLVCFRQQDFLDLELKKGPAVKILKELHRLKNNEPHPIRRPFRWSFRAKNKQENKKTNQPSRETKRKESDENPAPLINSTLDQLDTDTLRYFLFRLRHYTDSHYEPIPWGKLEGKDTMDIATLVTNHYGHEEALCVTRDILQKINQRELVSQLGENTGQVKLHHECRVDEEDTEKSDSSSCSRCQHKKREEKNVSCFDMNVKINLPSCFK